MRFAIKNSKTGLLYYALFCRAYAQDFLIKNPHFVLCIEANFAHLDALNKFEASINFKSSTIKKGTADNFVEIYPDERWLRCPQMISLYTLILRGLYNGHQISLEGFTLSNCLKDKDEISQTHKYWEPLIKNLDYIFPDNSIFYNLPNTILTSNSIFHSQGIGTFCKNNGMDMKSLTYYSLPASTIKYIEEINIRWREVIQHIK